MASSPRTQAGDADPHEADPRSTAEPLLSVRDLRVHFPVHTGLLRQRTGWVKAVDGVSLDIPRGRSLGLVGESGCGKTTTGRAILRLIGGRASIKGAVRFEERDVLAAGGRELRRLRRRMQIVFQDPAGSLDPRMKVGQIVGEGLGVHSVGTRAGRRARVLDLLDRCGLSPSFADRYPHALSGGQRQRVGVARALALEPRFIVCDEPTSALDVSVQAQIINLLMDLQGEFGLSYLFISHDMAVIDHVCDSIAVMHAGRIVEAGGREAVIERPEHPYTRTLLAAVPGGAALGS